MDSIKNYEQRLKEIEKAIQGLEQSIKHASKGYIICRNTRGITRFFKIQDNKPPEYLAKDKIDLIKNLSQKRYEETLLEALKEEYNIAEKALSTLKNSKKHKALKNFSKELKPFIKLNPITNEGYIQKWSQHNNPELPKDYTYREPYQTLKGDIVRSKSEILIADRLYTAKIPYHYEKRLELNGGATYRLPDFTILHPYTLETYYWEHLGLMHDEEYRQKAKDKIELYALNGIIQGKNLIITFEAGNCQLNTWYVDKLIEQYFTLSSQGNLPLQY